MRAGWGGGSPPRAGLCAGGRAKQPLCVRWPSGGRASGWRLRAINLRLGGRMEGAVCSPRFGCEAGRRPEGRRRRSSGQTGLGLGRQAQRTTQTGCRPAGSGPGAGGEAGGNAPGPQAPTRERCAASISEARRWGRHGSVVGRNPFPLYCPTRRRLSRATALGGAQAVELSELSDMNDRQSGDAAAFGDGQGGAGSALLSKRMRLPQTKKRRARPPVVVCCCPSFVLLAG